MCEVYRKDCCLSSPTTPRKPYYCYSEGLQEKSTVSRGWGAEGPLRPVSWDHRVVGFRTALPTYETHFRSISIFSLLPLRETESMMPIPIAIAIPIKVHVVPILARTPIFQRSEKAANQDNKTNKINTCPFHDKHPYSP